jgi:diguanylate cyclase (GGDEF)-like protein
MKRLLSTFAILFACATIAWAAPPAPLTSLRAIVALTNDQAAQQFPVAFEATVTYYARNLKNLNVQDDDIGIYVKMTKNAVLAPGDRVLVQGTTQPSFLPFVLASNITVLRHGALPKPLPVGFDDMVGTKINCRLIRVRGVVRAADLVSSAVVLSGHLVLLMEGGYIDIEVDSHDERALKDLLDAEVEVTGASGRIFDGKMQQIGAKIKVSKLADIKVIKRASVSPWSLPVTPLGEIVTGIHVRDLTARLRVHGTITYYQPGSAVVLQSGPRSLWIYTQTSEPLQIGDLADATGFPETHDGLLTLTHAEILDSHVQAPIIPQPSTWRQLALWGRSVLGGHQDDLVSIQGRVVTEVREASQDEYILDSDGRMFTAIYHHPLPPSSIPPMLQLPLGSRVRVTGICIAVDTNPFNDEAPFNILLRSFDDIKIVANPPLLSIRNLIILTGLLLVVLVVAGIRGWYIERVLHQKTTDLALRIEAEAALEKHAVNLEQQRSRILEDINGSRPLAEILERITELVSFQLKGAPCWCEVTDGAKLGSCPPQSDRLRIGQEIIPARSGPPLGVIFAGFDPATNPVAHEAEALLVGARLATLAIETRRLYSDLLHRSEFDQLTDIHNRFSLEQHLDAQINEARFRASIFGLIYIDLDDFKKVNDVYGHHIGDLYLQEVALRMKRQLRPHDTLARLGGDEFAALVPVVRNRAEVEEIAQRLERCFDEPFVIERLSLHGTTSVGLALYPENGASRDSLLNAADVAMYTSKNTKRKIK